MKLQKILLLSFVIILAIPSANSQTVQSLVPSIPTSPQAEAFKKYGEYAINYSTGVPDISIPLYEIDHHGYKIPIALKYNPQPLKPGYNYDVYGHGWGLSVNSSVSRSIEGTPDEWKGFSSQQDNLNNYYYESPSYAASYWDSGRNMSTLPHVNPYDYVFVHDKFNVVLPNGTSFDFILDRANNNGVVATVFDGRQVIIDCSWNSGNINSFTIIDEEGVKYTFDGSDTPYAGTYSSYSSSYVSWQLTRIDLPYSSDPINFSYDYSIQSPNTACREPGFVIAHYVGGIEDITTQDAPSPSPNYYKMKLLSSISYGSTQINLSYKDQNVCPYCPAYNYVSGIQIYEHASLIKDVKLDMTIYDVTGYCMPSKLAKLNSVSIRGSDLTEVPQVYGCTYQNSTYQFRGTDHWGYLNIFNTDNDLANLNLFVEFDPAWFGWSFNSSKLSVLTKSSEDINPYYKIKLSMSNYDNRSPMGDHGVLTRLSYPTGGYTDFEFENHKFLTSTDRDGNYILDPKNRIPASAAGFRIRKITNYTKDGIVADVKNFRYGKTNLEAFPDGDPNHQLALDNPHGHTGLGVAPVDPNILTYMDYKWDFLSYASSFIRNMVLGLSPSGEHISFSNPFVDRDDGFLANHAHPWRWETTFSATNFRRILNGRPPVLYPEVTVYYGEIDENSQYTPEKTAGKTVYKYDVAEHGFDLLQKEVDDAFIEPIGYLGASSTIDYIPQTYRYNKLTEKKDFKFNGQDYQPVKTENYIWYANTNYFFDPIFANPLPAATTPPYTMIGPFFQNKIHLFGVSLLDSKSTTLYSPTGESNVSSENYSYNSRNQISGIVSTKSNGKILSKTFSYPQDKSGDIIQKMIAKNIVSPVLESKTTVGERYQTPVETSGSRIDFKEYATGNSTIIMPGQSYELEITPSSSHYTLKNEVINYSGNGNPLEFVSKSGIRSAYLWGYDDRYMVAEVKNASAADIAYSSFEDNSKGNWNYSGTISTPAAGTFVPTGKNYYNLTSTTTLDKSVTNGKSYTISYWRDATTPYTITGGTGVVTTGPTVNGWTYFEHKVTATGTSIAISGTGGLDELRLYPADALMATYTYDPLIGITSLTDGNGRTSYYQYDALGRVQVMKDKDGNIVKTFDYKYKQ